MKKLDYDTLLFDLDGTLTDSAEGIISCVQYSAEKMGKKEDDREALKVFIGPPLSHMFHAYFGFEGEEIERAVAYYRERYTPVGIYENKVYDGVEEALKYLKAQGKKLAVATSKPEKFAKRIIEHFRLAPYFDAVYGADFEGIRSDKTEVIRYALRELKASDKKKVLMIGDRKYDVEGAHEADIACMGVLYGYGSRQELSEAGADFIIETPQEFRIAF